MYYFGIIISFILGFILGIFLMCYGAYRRSELIWTRYSYKKDNENEK